MLDVQVLISGGGPAGLSLALDLGRRGISCLLVERRTEPTKHPRATLLGARSMEYFRRFGIAEQILEAGIPTHHRYDVRFVTRLAGHLLHHYASPSPNEYREMATGLRPPSPDSHWSPYFKVQVGQHAIEPVLRTRLTEFSSVDVRYGWEMKSFEDEGSHVTAAIAEVGTQQTLQVRAAYLAACDGGHSMVRRQLGIPYTGRGAMRNNRSFLFRAPNLEGHAKTGRANLYFIFRPENFGVITNIDGRGLWNYSFYFLNSGDELRQVDPKEKIRDAMGHDFEFELLRTMDWSHHQSVADSFRSNRVFLLGDSAHLFSPTGGIGMNTAIGDGFDLGWKLGARLQGWGGERLLDSYELERRPIAFRNTQTAAANGDRIDSIMETIKTTIESDGPDGAAYREQLRPRFEWVAKFFNSMGAHLGGRYADSPIIIADGTPEPPDDPRIVVQSTWPGARAPHAWIGKNSSTLDAYDGAGFVLVYAGNPPRNPAVFDDAARRLGIPFKTVHYPAPEVAALYQRSQVLVRPDGHVCWRGDSLPEDPDLVLNYVTGRTPDKPSAPRPRQTN